MTVLSAARQADLVREASRAPSVHNVQPARWRFEDGGVMLLREPGRELPVGDPWGHDLQASLGAAWEGMSIALSRIGLTLGEPEPADDESVRRDDARGTLVTRAGGTAASLPGGGAPPRPWAPVARAAIAAGATIDPLAAHVHARRSHRGRFIPPSPEARQRLRALAAPDVVIVDDDEDITRVAALHDHATWHFERDADYHAELWRWLRLAPAHADWSRDGLNADCLALSRAERIGARVALHPRVFALLARLGVARHLVSEASQVRSAAGVVLFTPLRTLPDFEVGRRFHRLWLEITGAGLHAAPMSATSDADESRDALVREHAVPDDRRLANVLRVGAAGTVAESPRLPVDELLA